MSQRTFCVVIPTRNRAQLAKAALESVLRAGISHVKVLVSDNSTEIAESAALRSFCEQHFSKGVFYVRPGNSLPMAKHWDWAMQQTLQDPEITHVLYVTDRMLFKPGGLERLCDLAQRHPEQVISCSHDRLNDNVEPITVTQDRWTDRVYEITSASTLKACSLMQFDQFLPRMLNSVVPRIVMDRFLKRFGNCFSSIAPDFNFCFRYLLLFDSFIFVDRALLIHYALAKSNGATQQRSGLPNKDNDDLIKTPSGTSYWEGTLLPNLTTVGNIIIYEYLKIQRDGGGQRFPAVDKARYLAYLSIEVGEIKDPQRRMEWQNVLTQHNDGKPFPSENDDQTRRPNPVSMAVKTIGKKVAGVWINVNPQLIWRITPGRLRQELAAHQWKFKDSQRALYCALHFERPSERQFPRRHVQALEWTVLPESVR